MEILTIRKRFEAFKSKLKPFERDSKHSNANSNHFKGIRSIRMQIRKDSKHLNLNLNDLKGIQSIQMQILTIQKGFEAFECKF